MATKISLVHVTSQMQLAAVRNAFILGSAATLFSELGNRREHPVTAMLQWAILLLGHLVGVVVMIRSSNLTMRMYARLRGSQPNVYGLEAEIIPYADVLAFFLGVSTFVLIGGIYLFIATEMQRWGIILCAGIALLVAIISAVHHRQFVKCIEDALDAEENGWSTFHQWSKETFKELL